jgi:copper chaperone for superoxide dismutase
VCLSTDLTNLQSMAEPVTTVEFSVDMTCGGCEAGVTEALRAAGLLQFQVDLAGQRVEVTSDRPVDVVRAVLEGAGKRAVVVGAGARGAAVAMLGSGGDFLAGGGGPRGVVRLTQVDGEQCVIEGVVDGLSPGQHGLAIHEAGDTSRGCASLGGHYNPRGARHGSPELGEDDRHVGDLGNVLAGPDGRASFRLTDRMVKVRSKWPDPRFYSVQVWDVIGRSVVLASGPDDLGQGGAADGGCGPGVACGVIARSAGLGQNTKKICACDGVTLWDERDRPVAGEGRRAPPPNS